MLVKCNRCDNGVLIGKRFEKPLYECKKLHIYVENGEMLKCPAFERKPIVLPKKEAPMADEYLIEEYEKERIP